MSQATLPTLKERKSHGGDSVFGKRKSFRPLVTKRPLHLVLRSSAAVGKYSFLVPANRRLIEKECQRISALYEVKIYQMGNSGNHLHFVVRAKTRKGFQDFLRVLSGIISRKITGAEKGRPFGRRFWDKLAWTRIVEWGRDFSNALKYAFQNELEGKGIIPYQPRKHKVPVKTKRE